MSNEDVTYVVAGGCGLIAFIAFAWLVMRPAWQSYSRLWQRFAALFLTLYVAAAFIGMGVAGGLAVAWFWDRIEDGV
ncbi:MAG: hypothetical protein IRZ32_16395 [Solirubrobacteraceae bacterium]|nr:hypothetical protein [Solirubrobacteraceae bacterium]